MSSTDEYTVIIGDKKYKYIQTSVFNIKNNDLLYINDSSKINRGDKGIYKVTGKQNYSSNATTIVFYHFFLTNTNTNEDTTYKIECDTTFAGINCHNVYLVTDVVSIGSDDFTGKEDINKLVNDGKQHVVEVTYNNNNKNDTYRFVLYITDLGKIAMYSNDLNNVNNLKKLKNITDKYDGIIQLLENLYSPMKLSMFQDLIRKYKNPKNKPNEYEIKYYYKQPTSSGGGKRQNKRYLRKTNRKNKNKRRRTKSTSKKQ